MKPIKISLLTLVVSSIFFVGAVVYQKIDKNTQIAGKYTFSNFYGKSTDDTEIVLNDGKNTYSFFMENGMWKLKEKSGYFADYGIMNFVIKTIEKSKIYNHETQENDDFEFIPEWNIKTYNEGKLLDDVDVKSDADDKYLAKIGNDNKIYEISGNFDFPHSYAMWLQQSLLPIKYENIDGVYYNDVRIVRDIRKKEFESENEFNKDNLEKMLAALSNIIFVDVINSDELNDVAEKFSFSIEMKNGLMYNISLYKYQNKNYIKVGLDRALASYTGTEEYVKMNNVLYEGWAFEIDADVFENLLLLK